MLNVAANRIVQSTLGLDTQSVATSYMKLYDEKQEDRRKSRFF